MPDTTDAQIMDGTSLAGKLLKETTERSHRFASRIGRPPCLAPVLVGQDSASMLYLRMKTSPMPGCRT